MTQAPRRIAGAALALVASVVLFAGQSWVRGSRDGAVRTLLATSAQERSRSAHEELARQLSAMQGRAEVAASLQPIVYAASKGPDLADTLRDGLHSEPWWESYRHDFSLQGIAFERDQLDVLNTVDRLDTSKLDPAQLIRDARAHRSASLFMRIGALDWPYAASAAVIDTPNKVSPVLVLAKAFDVSFARELIKTLDAAQSASTCSVILSDGAHVLLSEGLNPQDAQALIGHERDPSYVAANLSWAAAGAQLLDGLTIWTAVSAGSLAKDVDADAATRLLAVRIIAGLLGLLGALLVLWPAPGTALLASEPSGQSEPALPAAPPAQPTGATDSGATLGAAQTTPGLAIRSGVSDPRLRKPASTGASEEAEGVTALQQAPVAASNVFGRYILLDLLGEGGMAEVFTAVTYGAERFRRSFVVKRLRAEMLRNAAVVSSFIDEANLASSLIHSNILPVFDFGKVGDEYYMATEYILGRDLGKLSRESFEKDEAALSLGLVFFAAHQTLEALDYAHHKKGDDGSPLGIVHRDISPNNILISARGEVKLFDFGIAKAEGRLTQTTFGTVKGNVRFMSPEQARGDPVDARSDLFAVALVIYYVLTGETFYTADSAYSHLVKAAHGPGETELANLARLPKEAQRILERALRIDPSDRFQSAAEFATALAPYIVGQQAALGRAMERLFGKELHEEQARFAAAAAAVGDAEKAEAAPRET